jgi:hypothetical protein
MEFRYDPLPDEIRAVIIASWKRGGLLPPAGIERMVPGAEPEATGMSDDLTNSQIALLCDIGECDLSELTGDQKSDLKRLLSEGYVEPTESHPGSNFKLTARAASFSASAAPG